MNKKEYIDQVIAEFDKIWKDEFFSDGGDYYDFAVEHCKDWIAYRIHKAYEQGASDRGEEYNELIMAVGRIYEGETRHQTALRYIKQAEDYSYEENRTYTNKSAGDK